MPDLHPEARPNERSRRSIIPVLRRRSLLRNEARPRSMELRILYTSFKAVDDLKPAPTMPVPRGVAECAPLFGPTAIG